VVVCGVGYAGSQTPLYVPEIKKELEEEDADCTILMMHCGVGPYSYGMGDGISLDEIMELKGVVDYLALGHYHTKFELDGWIYNPGSLETVSLSEKGPKGFYHFCDGEVKFVEISVRKIERIVVDVGDAKSPDELYQIVRRVCEGVDGNDAIVSLTLTGNLRFSINSLSLKRVKEIVKERLNPLYVDVSLKRHLAPTPVYRAKSGIKNVERDVIEAIVRSDARYSVWSKSLSELLIDVKGTAAKGDIDRAYETLEKAFRMMEEKHADSGD